MSIGYDNESTATNINPLMISTEKQKKLMKEIIEIKDPDEMRLYIINHQEIINSIPTKFLNSWNRVKCYKFIRRNGYVSYSVFNQGSADVIKTTREDITKLTDDFRRLFEIVNRIVILLKNNNLNIDLTDLTPSTQDHSHPQI
jgi:hypothetical protein